MLTVSGPGRAGIILSIVMFPFITATGQSQSCQCQTQCLLPHQPWRERPEPERGQTAPAQSRSLISATTQCLLYLGKHCENITQGPQKCVILKKKQGRCNPANLNNAMPKPPNYILHVILHSQVQNVHLEFLKSVSIRHTSVYVE